jgi:hypothetical protein
MVDRIALAIAKADGQALEKDPTGIATLRSPR